MQRKWLVILTIGMIALFVAACGNQSNGAEAVDPNTVEVNDLNTESVNTNTEAPEHQPSDDSQQTSHQQLYENSVFLGDSITEGLLYHNVLSEDNVLAGAGKTVEIAIIEDNIAQIFELQPEQVFIQLGSTDILWPVDDPIEHSLTHYAQLIADIKSELPETKIILLSITPVTTEAEELEPRYNRIQDYNEGLKKLAAQQQVEYIDLTALVTEHSELYDDDGIHFQAEFYSILLDYLQSVATEQ